MKRFEDAIHELASIRSRHIEAALAEVYKEGGPYWSDDRLELFRSDLPTERDMELHTASVLANHLGVYDPHWVSMFTDSYTTYGYHCLSHGVLAAILTSRMCNIYLPYHPDMRRVAVVAAMFHDSFHSHGALPDSENVSRAQRYIRNVVAVHGDRMALGKSAAQTICEILRLTEWTLGEFPHDIPESSTEPLEVDASEEDQRTMAMRIVAEADLMMSATPFWPALGGVIAHDMSTTGNDANLDIETFCRAQMRFIEKGCMTRVKLPENVLALQAVLDLHRIVFDLNT